jgi:alkanesulfonate monooxygenase SsuD/methylene tetrahydromethanopterin reductase-like flavin-dependent oxidoreductase (luciferase family)
LAKAITAIDQLSGGRADMGIGAGWAKVEYDAYGIPFPDAKTRLDQLEEGIQCLRGLLHDDVTSFEGRHFTLTGARNEPRPVQAKLPIWIGGGGEKRTLKIAARYADGWNVPFIAPDQFSHKNAILDTHCAAVGRDPKDIKRAINVGLAYTEDSLQQQFGAISDLVRPGVLSGSDGEILDRIGQYVDAGADQVNIALRAPFNLEAAQRLSAALQLS